LLYALPFPLEQIPKVSVVANWYEKGWQKLMPWVGAHILHLSKPITYFMSGSGDKTSDWVQLLCQLVFAIVATVIWSVLDRKRKNYNLLHAWMRVYLATYLGIFMFGYGLAKVIPSQMPYPPLSHMMEPFGYQSPMGLLWYSIGAAPAYEIFAGSIETLAGILMFIPRMTTLGALVGVGAMANVFMLNMTYDIPVKQFSCHLMLFFGLLLIPDLKRLLNFFVLNRSADPECSFAVSQRRAPNYAIWGLRWALAVFAIYGLIVSNLQYRYTPEKLAKENPLYGIWSVDQFTLDGKDHPPLVTDNERWERMIFDFPGSTEIQDMHGIPLLDSIGAPARFGTKIDKAKNTIELKKSSDPTWKFEAKYDRPQPDVMTIDGQWDGKPIRLKLHKEEHPFFLSNRGFHWVNEVSLNR
jgi:uncharacterized membrane protein YphA (DoxX/SURF4 family)